MIAVRLRKSVGKHSVGSSRPSTKHISTMIYSHVRSIYRSSRGEWGYHFTTLETPIDVVPRLRLI